MIFECEYYDVVWKSCCLFWSVNLTCSKCLHLQILEKRNREACGKQLGQRHWVVLLFLSSALQPGSIAIDAAIVRFHSLVCSLLEFYIIECGNVSVSVNISYWHYFFIVWRLLLNFIKFNIKTSLNNQALLQAVPNFSSLDVKCMKVL